MAARLLRLQSNRMAVSRITFSRISPLRNTKSLHMGEHFTRGSLHEIELKTAVPLAGRKYLVGSNSSSFPKHLSGPREDFPLLVKAKKGQEADMKHWALRCKEIIDQAYQRYMRYGIAVAILFRGLPNRSAKDFSDWVNNLGFEPFPYVGGTSARNEIERNVDEGALDENVVSIEPHNEMSYAIRFPKIFTISCFQKPEWGGETAICDNRDILAKLDKDFVSNCKNKEIRYWTCLHSKDSDKRIYQSWQMRFRTEDKDEVDEFLRSEKYRPIAKLSSRAFAQHGNEAYYAKRELH